MDRRSSPDHSARYPGRALLVRGPRIAPGVRRDTLVAVSAPASRATSSATVLAVAHSPVPLATGVVHRHTAQRLSPSPALLPPTSVVTLAVSLTDRPLTGLLHLPAHPSIPRFASALLSPLALCLLLRQPAPPPLLPSPPSPFPPFPPSSPSPPSLPPPLFSLPPLPLLPPPLLLSTPPPSPLPQPRRRVSARRPWCAAGPGAARRGSAHRRPRRRRRRRACW